MKMTSVEMCLKQAVIRGREGCQPDTWDCSEGLQLVYTSGERNLNARRLFCLVTWICTNAMPQVQRGRIVEKKE